MRFPTSRPVDWFRFLLPIGILGVGVAACAAISSQRQPPQRVELRELSPQVESVAVQTHHGGLQIKTDGMVVPYREVHLSAEVGGRVVFKAPQCRAGRFVNEGQLLVTIDPREYQLEVQRLERELDQAVVGLRELDVEIANAQALIALAQEKVVLQQKQLERARSLFGRGATSEAEFEDAQQAELAARQDHTTLTNQLRQLETSRDGRLSARQLVEARLAQARLDVERTEVRAPIDGVIVSEAAEQDDYVQAGSALLTLEDTSAVEVRCQLRVEELAWLWLQDAPQSAETNPHPQAGETSGWDYQLPRATVTITYDIHGQTYRWQGELSRYEGVGLDERTRTVPVRILVPNPRQYEWVTTAQRQDLARPAGPRTLLRGMYVQLVIHAQPGTSLLVLPERAVQPGNVVWRIRDGKLNIVPLHNLRLLDDSFLVPLSSSDLRAGDEIITSPLSVAVEGMEVLSAGPPQEARQPSAAVENARS